MPRATIATGGIDLRACLSPLAALPRDPTVRLTAGRFERATLTPEGAASVVVTWGRPGGSAEVETFGDGAAWLLERAPALLGCEDDVAGFAPGKQPLRDLWRRHGGDRIGRTSTLWHDLAWFVVQQRIDRTDAAAQWGRLVAAGGGAAPGIDGLLLPPAPDDVARLGLDGMHALGIDGGRAAHLVRAARVARQLQTFVDRDHRSAAAALRSVPGIGPWTVSCLLTQTWGSADTVIRGDAGIPSMVAWILAGERSATDERMLSLLAPYVPHRYRVIRLCFLSGVKPPRRAPRGTPHDIRRH